MKNVSTPPVWAIQHPFSRVIARRRHMHDRTETINPSPEVRDKDSKRKLPGQCKLQAKLNRAIMVRMNLYESPHSRIPLMPLDGWSLRLTVTSNPMAIDLPLRIRVWGEGGVEATARHGSGASRPALAATLSLHRIAHKRSIHLAARQREFLQGCPSLVGLL